MKVSLNCIFLGTTTISNSFAVSLKEKNNEIEKTLVDYDDVKIVHLKFLIWNKKKGMLKIDDSDTLNLWKVASDVNLEDIITEEQIKAKGEKLVPIKYVSEYFLDKTEADDSLIIVQVPTGKCIVINLVNMTWLDF